MNLLWWLALLSFKQNVLVSGGFSSSATKLAKIWETLEWKNVTIYSAHIGGPSTVGVMKETGKVGKTTLQFLPLEDLLLLTPLHEYKGGIPLAHHAVAIFFDDWRGSHERADLVTSAMIGHRHDLALVVTDDLREAELYWRDVDFNVAFYAASLSATDGLVERVMLQRNGQNVLRTPIAGKGEREQSLSSGHGQNLEFNVIPFKPQIQIKSAEDGAESDGSSKFEGIVVDYLDIMSRHSNFSYSLILEESGDFGTLPSGHQTLSNSSGMLRSLIGGDFASSAAIWTQSEGRARWLHYATTLMPTTMNCFVSTRFLSQHHDRWFLARPFTAGAWALILAVVALAGLCHLTFEDKKFRRILAAVMGLFFVIVNAYYSGALVMDLISSRSLPFDNLLDALSLYPEWKMLTMAGHQNIISNNFDLRNPAYRKMDQLLKSPQTQGEHVKGSIAEVLDLLSSYDEKYFLYDTADKVSILVRSTYSRHPGIVPICSPVDQWGSLVSAKNSPYTKVFDSGALLLWESGAMRRIQRRWFGDQVKQGDSSPPASPLSLSHLTVAFAAISACAPLVVVVLCAEVFNKAKLPYP